MKMFLNIKISSAALIILLIPALAFAQAQPSASQAPPIEQPLVREGDFAVELVRELGLGTTSDESEAETILGSVGISPRNGWIADYPVTPDITGEIQQSVSDAADSHKLPLSRDEALKRFQNVKATLDLEIRGYQPGETHELNPGTEYPETTVINNYYYEQGPPVVTYYAPPPDYYYLYSWVPYPFWWFDFWFPGFFILNDFHRSVHFHHRTEFISNHFNDFSHHRVHRIDPVDRFHGRTFAGIGAPKTGRFLSLGVRNAPTSVFNRNRINPPATGRTFRTPAGRSFNAPSGGRSFRTPSGGRTFSTPSSNRNFRIPAGRSSGPPSEGGSFRAPSGSRSFSPPSTGRTFRGQSGTRPFSVPSQGRSFGSPSGGRSASPPSGNRGSSGGHERR
ncbi:MAG TPA: hypothetical protein VK435_09790 [Thermodesulfovibrionales bacterium]|nr:hypothetical protein [Thermodesulfovibrionales bacterium]